jgi:Universal stress protein family
MREQDRPVVVLVERKASDEDVMREARARIVAEAAPLVLVHVAPLASDAPLQGSRWQQPPEPWQRMLGLEATVSYDLRLMARDWVGPATPVDIEVRFADAVTELAAVAEARGARLVVARSQPSRWLFGRDRDKRLRWAVNGPLRLVRVAGESRWAERLHPIPAAARWRL